MQRIPRRPPFRISTRHRPSNEKVERKPLVYDRHIPDETARIPCTVLEVLCELQSGRFYLTDAGCAKLLVEMLSMCVPGSPFLTWVYAFLRAHHEFGIDALGATMLLFLNELNFQQKRHTENTTFTPSNDLSLIQRNAQVVAYRKDRASFSKFFYFPWNLIGPIWRRTTIDWKWDAVQTAVSLISDPNADEFPTTGWFSVIAVTTHCLQLPRMTQLSAPKSYQTPLEPSTDTLKAHLHCIKSDLEKTFKTAFHQIFPFIVRFASVDLLENLISFWLPMADQTLTTGKVVSAICGNVYFDSTVVTKTFPEEFDRFHACLISLLRRQWPEKHHHVHNLITARGGDFFLRKYIRNYRALLLREAYDTLCSMDGSVAFPRAFCVSLLQGPCRDFRHFAMSNKEICSVEKRRACWKQTLSNALILLRRDAGTLKIIIAQGQELFSTVKQCAKARMTAEFHSYKRAVWKEFSMLIMRGHRKHMYNVLCNLCNTAGFLLEALLSILHFCSLGFSKDFAQKFLEKHPKRIVLTPRLLKLLSHPAYRLASPQEFWWRCHCVSGESQMAHLNWASMREHMPVDDMNLKDSLVFLHSDDTKDVASADFAKIFADVDTLSLFDRAINPGSTTICSNCSGYTCQCGRTYPSAVAARRCPTCHEQSTWHAEAARANLWYCPSCRVPVKGKVCSECNGYDERHFWECPQCRHQNPNETSSKSSYCLQCGELKVGCDAREAQLMACDRCGTFHFAGDDRDCGVNARRSASIPYFTWKCGCGAQNSPFERRCWKCEAQSFRCMWCFRKQKVLAESRRKYSPSARPLACVSRDFCSQCRMPHPRTWALFTKGPSSCAAHSDDDSRDTQASRRGILACEWISIHRASLNTRGSQKATYIFPFSVRRVSLQHNVFRKRHAPFDLPYWICWSCSTANSWREPVCVECEYPRSEGVDRLFFPAWGVRPFHTYAFTDGEPESQRHLTSASTNRESVPQSSMDEPICLLKL
ncbi:DNA polymerase II large subunit [Perkinsela sp. CCAP 1560/4]|nr:DNA polymerase II large subunit [Perkinsela sp. CCAP 1560/4]|eukprot:KNH07406.1 DNA polymerase II large subunit [Perkinsela sp. CCAP 1560/4]